MNLWINCALFSYCINKVYSRVNIPFLHQFSNFLPQLNYINVNNQVRRLSYLHSLDQFNMPVSSKSKYFNRSSLSHNNSLKNPVAEVLIVPVLQDNYSYVLKDPESSNALCVDPVEYEKVYNVCKENDLELKLALCTHKHWDHSVLYLLFITNFPKILISYLCLIVECVIGGNNGIKKLVPDVEVVGSSYEETPGVTLPVKHEQTLTFGNLVIKCLKASCHTLGHIMYYVYHPSNDHQQPLLFSGDTLFISGCGRFFEGDARSMMEIVETVKSLPENTLLYCGHEYTLKNLQFAYSVDKSDVVFKKLNWSKETVSKGLPTVPSTLQEEKLYNPFMRVKELMKSLDEQSEESTMNKLRSLKDRF
ncbi:hydroxyacylglutathione hydrolase, putative [Theileria annulata]|uniref:hydroxyacylglutathione hydrolase n=1 Tax=Theileria annulata TaxID=5874 RepID=Q4UGN4_THEAN|nr:hydroxyacylglutathione hydrolase, putative [Theileria annulata]CAI73755.1 hydroxyacylglutathione hydrolase, putative [Theileria annulata]|eukprot:XP_954432.1 hydroxyacylglutathione hydrolase, putative [Theileria annulata]